ncbi:MAG TPA: S9 family peptidase [Acidimicrobiales bacterium]|jgi:dipeptidyl aminopeptidase/acylaminoacyl peptidase|nr:S9 family peptidase [Acidimicrobiales bacterium]
METQSPFASMDAFLAVPRVGRLVLSPDGSTLVAPVQTLAPDGKKYLSALWRIDPDGGPARRLTWSSPGETAPAFLPDGDLLFVSARPDPAPDPGATEDSDGPGLWRLPAGGGDAQLIATRPGGLGAPLIARDSATVVVTAGVLHGAADDDAKKRADRRSGDVSAILHEGLPVRHWDHDLGPEQDRLLVLGEAGPSGRCPLRDLTPDAGSALVEAATAITPDGATVFTSWRTVHPGGRESIRLQALDVAAGTSRVFAARDDDPGDQHDYTGPAVSPDGRLLVHVDVRTESGQRAPTQTLVVADLATGETRDLLAGFGLWPQQAVFAPDSSAVFFLANQAGHCPLFRVELDGGQVTRLSRSGAYSEICPSPDGAHVYALRNHIDSPPRPVRLDARAADQDPVYLDAPGAVAELPGRMEEVEAEAPDGARVRAWLVRPEGDAPAPLLLWVHGGPLMSWDTWSWRWNPWLMAARGWAVLLPDPGLSDGYGDDFVQRAWGHWGPVPFADLMAVTDATVARPDIDGTRTAAMGGSYGGYMTNWIAGHTDRFQALVTHASLWALESFMGSTDHPGAWMLEWGYADTEPDRYERNSPNRHASALVTPMLVIHGDRDYRVPIGEGLGLWSELTRRGVEAKFLYFPDEGHWILKPGNVKVWYQTVHAFLEHHVLGQEWVRPDLV